MIKKILAVLTILLPMSAQALINGCGGSHPQTVTNFNPATPVGYSTGLTFGLSATGSTSLPIVYGSTTTSVCTVSGSTVSVNTPGTCTLTAYEQAGTWSENNCIYTASPTVTANVTINPVSQTISFGALANQQSTAAPFAVSATASSGLSVSFSASGVCSVSGSTVTLSGSAGTCSITASQAGDLYHAAATPVTQSFIVTALTAQSISFPAPPAQTYGNAPFSVSASASSGLAVSYSAGGACSNSGSTITITGAGTCSITASQGGNGTYAAATPVTDNVSVAKANQSISYTAIGTQTYSSNFTLPTSASASSGLPVTYTSSGNCTNSGGTVTVTGVGSCTLYYNQSGNTNFNAAPQASQTFSIVSATQSQSVSFNTTPGSYTYSPSPQTYNVLASASSGGAVTYSVSPSTTCSISGTSVSLIGGGICTITASQAGGNIGGTNYNPASASQNVTVNLASQSISFPTPGPVAVDGTVTLNASASSGLAVSYTSVYNSYCTVSGNVVTGVSTAGSCIIAASQAGNNNYSPATTYNQAFQVVPGTQTISFPAPPSQTYSTTPIALSATASPSGLAVSFTSNSTGVCTTGGTNGVTVTMVTYGTCLITASQAGNSNWNAASSVQQSFSIAAQSQTISFTPPAAQTYGVAPLTLSATASPSGLAVSFSSNSPGVCTTSGSTGNTLTITGGGTCSITATQGGNATYGAATPVTKTFTVNPATQTISFGSLSSQAYGNTPPALAASASSGLAVSYTSATTGVCTVSGTAITLVATGTCTIDANQAGNPSYTAAAQVAQSFTVAAAAQTITFPAIASQLLGVAPPALSASASSGLTVVYTSATASVCTVSGSTMTLVAAGTCTIDANQVGNGDYQAAPQAAQSFTVNQNNASYVSQSVPANMFAGQSYPVSITVQNTGTTTWNSAALYRLGAQSPQDNTEWGSNRIALPSSVAPGQQVTFSTTVTAPADDGSYTFQWEMVEDQVQWFGAQTPAVSVTVATAQSQTISFPAISTQSLNSSGGGSVAISASTNASLLIGFNTSSTPSVCSVGSGTLSGSTTSATVTLLTAGTCTVTATQSGNTTYSAAAPVSQSFTIQNGPPTALISAPTNGASYLVTSGGSVMVNVGGGGNSSTATVVTTAILVNGSVVQSSSGNNINANLSFTAGSYAIQIQTTDNNGLVGTSSPADINVVTDVAATVSISAPTNGASYIAAAGGTASVPVSASANSTNGQVIASFKMLVDGSVVSNGSPETTSASFSTNVALAIGTHTIQVTAADSLGTTGQSTVSVTVTALPAQTITFNNPGAQTLNTSGGGSIGISASTNSSLLISFNASTTPSVCSVGSATLSGSTTSATVTFLTAGTCTVTATQAGNASYAAASVTQSFTISAGSVLVNLQSPTANQSVIAANGLTLTASASETGGSIASVVFYATPAAGGSAVNIGSSTSGSNGVYSTSANLSGLAAGGYLITAVATDALSNSATSSAVSITITGNQGDSASFVSQGLTTLNMRAGQPYQAIITMQNNGTTTWPANSNYKLGAQDPQDNRTWGTNGRVELTSPVAPGQNATFSFHVTAPAETASTTIPMQWQMVNEDVDWFGAQTPVINVTVAPGPGPIVTLSASPSDVRMNGNTPVTVTFSGSGNNSNDGSANIVELDLYEDSGTGFGSSPIQSITGGSATLNLPTTNPFTVSLGAGLYRFKLRATDNNGVPTDSTPVLVSVTNSPLLGQVNGVEINNANGTNTPQLFGWVCQSGNATGLNYQVYVNGPPSQGGTQIGSGTANVSGQADDTTVQGSCGTAGASHDFTVDLSSFTSQYPGAPLYVLAQDGSGDSIVLPCQQNNCTMPNGLVISLTTPQNNDQYAAPATVFVRATVANGSSNASQVSFNIAGQNVPAIADTAPNTYYAATPSQLPAGTYQVTASINQGDMTLQTMPAVITVVPGDGATLTLGSPTAGAVNGASIALAATQGGTQLAGATLQFYANGVPITNSVNAAENNSGNWTATWSNVASGTYAVTAKLFDGSGNLQAETAPTIVSVSSTGAIAALSSNPTPVDIAPPYIGNPDAGSLPGSLTVGNNGAATYSIPIAVPPGTNGMAPQLSLNYSSLAGNGVAGYGWSLAGGSSIHRCVQTIAQDGHAGPVTLSSSDALCLDGKRLVLVSGTYGQAGSIYRTEIDNFARITAINGYNGQIAFTVETKDGKTMTYGGTQDSSVAAVGTVDVNGNPTAVNAPVFWDLHSVIDHTVDGSSVNNSILYNYAQNGTTGEHLLMSITYGNASAQYASVVFTYECRNLPTGTGPTSSGSTVAPCANNGIPYGDADIEYVAGARADVRNRLRTIQTFTDGSGSAGSGLAAQTTALTYTQSATSGRSLLSQASVCALNAQNQQTCLQPTQFTWGAPAPTNTSYPANSFVANGIMQFGPPQDWTYKPESTYGDAAPGDILANPGTDYQQKVGGMIVGDFVGDGKTRILTAEHGQGVNGGAGGWHVYTARPDGSGFDVLDLPFASNPQLPTQLDFGVPPAVASTPSYDWGKYTHGPVIIGDFDGDGAADIAFIDQRSDATDYMPAGGNSSIVICLSRLATTGGFDCQTLPLPTWALTAAQQAAVTNAQSVFADAGQQIPATAPTQMMFLGTQANGRSDILTWWPGDPSSVSNTRCSYAPPSNGNAWTINCGPYPGVYAAMRRVQDQTVVPISPILLDFWPIMFCSPGGPNCATLNNFITNNTVGAATAPASYFGDFWGTRQTAFISAVTEGNQSTQPGIGTNADLFVAVANSTVPVNTLPQGYGVDTDGFTAPLGFYTGSATYPNPAPPNQFAWSTGGANAIQLATQRYFLRESKDVEAGGTPLSDLNGDGYTDYLFTYEGHAEICYSRGATGFDCRLMEDQTGNWSVPTLSTSSPAPLPSLPASYLPSINYNPATYAGYTSISNVPVGSTVTFDGNGLVPSNPGAGLYGVYSVLTVGHAHDGNLSEVIYRRGNGGNFNTYQANNGGPGVGGDQYWVCTLRDGLKQCQAWTGPNLRPYASGSDANGFPLPGLAYYRSANNTVAWPNAGTLVGDFTGSGRSQVLWYCNSQCTDGANGPGTTNASSGHGWQLFSPNVSGPIDRLTQVVNGNSNTSSVSYLPMSNPAVYTPQATDINSGAPIVPAYPLQPVVDNGRLLVASITTDNGQGSASTLTSTYTYAGLVSDASGRGEQGFAVTTVTNPQGTVGTNQYAQGFPYTGMVLATTLSSGPATGNLLLQRMVNSLPLSVVNGNASSPTTVTNPQPSGTTSAGISYCSYTPISTTDRWDLATGPGNTFFAQPMSHTVSTVVATDSYCNTTSASVAVSPLTASGPNVSAGTTYTSSTVNQINNIQSPVWIVGQLAQTAVAKVTPQMLNGSVQSAITRTTAYTYYGNGAMASETTEPGNSVLSVTTSYDRSPASTCAIAATAGAVSGNIGSGNLFGQLNCVGQTWTDPVSGHNVGRTIKASNYDTQGRYPTAVANALGHVETHSYDDTSGAQLSLTGPNLLTTTWTVDGFGRPLTETHPDHTQTNSYRKLCNGACPSMQGVTPATVTMVDHVTDSTLGNVRTAVPELVYADTAGHPLRHQSYGFDGTEIDTDNRYNSLGQLVVAYQPTFTGTAANIAKSMSYDELNRVLTVSSLDEGNHAQTTTTAYAGLSVTVTNPLGYSKTDTHDALGQLVQSTDALGNNTQFVRDAWGNLVQTIDPKQNTVSIAYDNLGRKIQMVDPDLGTIQYKVDPRGLLYWQQSPNEAAWPGLPAGSAATTFQYDQLDRLVQRNEPDLTSAWVYDQQSGSGTSCATTASCGKLIEAYTLTGVTKDYDRLESYDPYGRPSQTSTTLDTLYTSSSAYDSYGRLHSTSERRGSGSNAITKTFDQRYNQYGYLAQIVRDSNNQVLWQASRQDAADRVTVAELGNGLTHTLAYSPYSARFTGAAIDQGSNTAQLEGYYYDPLGNVTTRSQNWNLSNTGFTENFTYDPINRLHTSQVVSSTQAQQVFDYDALGNIDDKTGVGNGALNNYHYGTNVANGAGPHAVTGIDGLANGTFTYDADGNMLTGNGRSYTPWTSFDMPNSISGAGGSSSFLYGPEHQRTMQTQVAGSTTTAIYYAGAMETDANQSSNVTTVKTYWPMGLGFDSDPITNGTPGTTQSYWVHKDRLGSVIAISDSTGTLQQQMDYDAWGSRRDFNGDAAITAVTANNKLNGQSELDDKGFTGQEMLDQLALVHLNGRIYDPLIARFISADPEIQDPTHSQSYNRYTYVWNNPTNDTDPSGFKATDDGGAQVTSECAHSAACTVIDVSGALGAAAAVRGAVSDAMEHGQTIVVVNDAGNPVSVAVFVSGTGTETGGNPSSTIVPGAGVQGSQLTDAAAGGKNSRAGVELGNNDTAPAHSGPYVTIDVGENANGITGEETYHYNTKGRLGEVAVSIIPVVGGIYYAFDSAANGDLRSATFFFGSAALDMVTIEGGGALRAARAAKTAGQLGKEGEAAVRAVYDIGDKPKSILMNGRGRIPDGLKPGESLSEVKNVDRLSLTRQLRDYSEYSQAEGLRFDLYTRPNTQLSGPLQDAIDSGLINHLHIP